MATRTAGHAWPEAAATARGHRLSARTALLASFAAAASIGLVGWAAWSLLRTAGEDAHAARAATASALASGLDREVEDLERHLEMLGASRGLDAADGSDAAEAAAVHETWLHVRTLEDVALVTPEGRVLASARRGPLPAPGVLAAAAAQVRPTATMSGPDAGPCLLHLVVPLRDWHGTVATLAVGVLDPRGAGWERRLVAGRGGTAALVDDHGHVRAGRRVAGAAAVRARMGRAPLTVEWQPGPARDLPRAFALRAAILTPIVLGVALLLAWGAARSVTSPLLALGAVAERIAGGDLDRPVPAQGSDEVGRLAAALERMRAALAARERDRERGLLLGRLIAVQEEERKRIARELHDETCQRLSALCMRLDAASGSPPAARRGHLSAARGLAGSALDEVHRVIHALRPSVLDDLGLVAALRWTAERTLGSAGVAVDFAGADDAASALPAAAQTALFRAAQEALHNVARHASASRVSVLIARGADVEVTIADDGVGFDPDAFARPAASGRGLGLLGIRERLALAGGSASFESRRGRGTRVVLRVPVPAVVREEAACRASAS
jgi:signal transduction histidine kinase